MKNCSRLQPQQSLRRSPREKHSLQEEKAGHSLSVIQPCARHNVYDGVLNNSSAITTCQMPLAKPQTEQSKLSKSQKGLSPQRIQLSLQQTVWYRHTLLWKPLSCLFQSRADHTFFFSPQQSNTSKSQRGYAFSRKDSRRSFAKGRCPQHLIREEDGTAQKHINSRYSKREESRAEMQAEATRG